MTQVSRRYIPPWVMEKILYIFLTSLRKIKDDDAANKFFDEFLTPTEKLMLMKRITCFHLLYKNVSIRKCADLLKLSTATVAKYSVFLKRNTTITNILDKVLKDENFFRLVDTLINEYLFPPGRVGSNWKTAGQQKVAYEQRKKSPL